MYSRFKWPEPCPQRNRLTRIYEPLQPFVLMELARSARADLFIDVGANIGLYTAFMTQLPDVKEIHAFEAAPTTYPILQQMVEANRFGARVTTHPLAVSSLSGEVRFGLVTATSGANSVIETSIHSGTMFTNHVTVPTVPLDKILGDLNRVCCLKIDVEGHESHVLRGAEGLISRNQVLIQIEIYEEGSTETKLQLERLGLHNLCRCGPDYYYTNIDFAEANFVQAVFERAINAMVASNLEDNKNVGFVPIRRKLPWGIVIEISGSLAGWARRNRDRISNTKGLARRVSDVVQHRLVRWFFSALR